MTTSSTTQNTSATVLADIISPPSPPPSPLAIAGWALAALLLLSVMAGVLRRWWFGRRGRIRRRVRRIRRDLTDGRLQPRAAAFRIADAVRGGLRCVRLNAAVPPAGPDSDQAGTWRRFVRRLDIARFAPDPPSRDTVDELLAEAGRWLR